MTAATVTSRLNFTNLASEAQIGRINEALEANNTHAIAAEN